MGSAPMYRPGGWPAAWEYRGSRRSTGSPAAGHPPGLYIGAEPMRVDHVGSNAIEDLRQGSRLASIGARRSADGEHLRAAVGERSLERMRSATFDQNGRADRRAAQ